VHVMDVELATMPLTRFQVRSQRAQGGISVRLAAADADSVEIRFMDEYGADIDEGAQRKIERLLYREDFRRAFAGDIGDIVFPPRATEFYTAALEPSVQHERLASRGARVVLAGSGTVDFAASQEGGFIWPSFLPAYDAVATLVHLLDLLASSGRALSSIVAEVPETHIAHEVVPTPWERKGTVMRGVMERAKDFPTVLVDGVKIVYPEGWALVLPDPELAITHIWAEGASDVEARRLVAIHAGQVAELTR